MLAQSRSTKNKMTVPYKKQDDSALQHRTYFYSMPNFEHTIACTKYKGVRHDMYYENVV